MGVLVSSYYCSTYRVADPFSSLGNYSSSSIGGPVIHSIADREHPRLCLLGPWHSLIRNSYIWVLSAKSYLCMQWCQRLGADYGMDPRMWQSLDGPSFCLLAENSIRKRSEPAMGSKPASSTVSGVVQQLLPSGSCSDVEG